jgi:hypothetical protein
VRPSLNDSSSFVVCDHKFVTRYSALADYCVEGGTLDGAMIGHGEWRASPVGVLSFHRDMIAFADQAEAKDFQRLDDLGPGSANREFGH